MTHTQPPGVAGPRRLLWRVMAALPDGDLGAADAAAGSVIAWPGQTWTIEIRRRYTLLVLNSGSLVLTIDGRTTELRPGEVALLRPGGRERWRFGEETESQHSWLTLGTLRLPAGQAAQLDAAPIVLPVSAALAQLFTAAQALSEAPPAAHSTVVWLAAAALALYVAEAQALGHLGAGSRLPVAITAAQALVRRRLSERIELDDLAAAGPVAPAHLVRLFRRHLGTTPVRYLWQERVQMGVFLLEHTGLPIGEIASRTGFRTAKHFARLVRATTGRSPREVRRRS